MKCIRIVVPFLLCFAFSPAGAMGLKPGVKKQVIAYPGGLPRMVYSFYVEGGRKRLHGEYREYSTSGEILKKFHYSRGVLHGSAVEYYPSGRKKWTGRFFEGRRVGRWIFRGKNGKKKIEGDFDKEGRILALKHYHPNGRIKKKEIFRDGKIEKILSWSINGERQPDQIPGAALRAPDFVSQSAFPEVSPGVDLGRDPLEEGTAERSAR